MSQNFPDNIRNVFFTLVHYLAIFTTKIRPQDDVEASYTGSAGLCTSNSSVCRRVGSAPKQQIRVFAHAHKTKAGKCREEQEACEATTLGAYVGIENLLQLGKAVMPCNPSSENAAEGWGEVLKQKPITRE